MVLMVSEAEEGEIYSYANRIRPLLTSMFIVLAHFVRRMVGSCATVAEYGPPVVCYFPTSLSVYTLRIEPIEPSGLFGRFKSVNAHPKVLEVLSNGSYGLENKLFRPNPFE